MGVDPHVAPGSKARRPDRSTAAESTAADGTAADGTAAETSAGKRSHADRPLADSAQGNLILPQLAGPQGEYARKVVRLFVDGGRGSSPLVVLSGPPQSGKTALIDWACHLGGGRVFKIDPKRLRGGSGFVPRKPLVVCDGIEAIASAAGAQRRMACILDEVRDRGDRVLVSLEGLPTAVEGFHDALRCRLQGGLLVSLPAPDRATRRLQLRYEARKLGRRLPATVEDELAALPSLEGLELLRHRAASGSLREGALGESVLRSGDLPLPPLDRMKDAAARLFHVDRSLLDEPIKRRSVVEARRAIMAAAVAEGMAVDEIRRTFQVSAARTVREACRWAERKSATDERFAAMVSELGRVAGSR